MPPKEKYTDPELRDEIKEELKEGDKGGAPGQWSARKAQMMAAEYKKRGGDYNTDKSEKDESQRNLDKWGEEDWQTKEGSGNAKQEDGSQKRYLPKKAWDKMTEGEKRDTDEKKLEESKEGKQYVDNTDTAKEKRKEAVETSNIDDKEDDDGKQSDKSKSQKTSDAASKKSNGTAKESPNNRKTRSSGKVKEAKAVEEHTDSDTGTSEGSQDTGKKGAKRKRSSSQGDSNKKPKLSSAKNGKKVNENSKNDDGTFGSKHMSSDEPAPRGSNDRLPKKGQKAFWKAMPGIVDGKVEEVLTKGKSVDGKQVKASADDPKIVLKSNKSGKICVHKPDACFYD